MINKDYNQEIESQEILIIRPKQAAKKLGISMSTLWRRAKTGQIKIVSLGSRARGIKKSDIDKIVEQGFENNVK